MCSSFVPVQAVLVYVAIRGLLLVLFFVLVMLLLLQFLLFLPVMLLVLASE